MSQIEFTLPLIKLHLPCIKLYLLQIKLDLSFIRLDMLHIKIALSSMKDDLSSIDFHIAFYSLQNSIKLINMPPDKYDTNSMRIMNYVIAGPMSRSSSHIN